MKNLTFTIQPNRADNCFDITMQRPAQGGVAAATEHKRVATKELGTWLRDLANQGHIVSLEIVIPVGSLEPVYLGQAVSA
jgi:hypothetical protein